MNRATLSKVFAWVGVVLITLVLSAGLLLFTKIGNTILIPFAQSALNHSLPFSTQIHSLHISPRSLQADLSINKSLSIALEGSYSPRGLDMVARAYPLDSKTLLTTLRIVGRYGDYTIATQNPPDMRAPLLPPLEPSAQTRPNESSQSAQLGEIALLAHMRFLSVQDYALRAENLPAQLLAQILRQVSLMDNAPKGRVSLLMQAESSQTQIGIKSSGFSLAGTPLGVDFYYKQSSQQPQSYQLLGRFTLPHDELLLRSTGDDMGQNLDSSTSTLHTALYSARTPQEPIATLELQPLPTSLRYMMDIRDLGAFAGAFGLEMSGGLSVQGALEMHDEPTLDMSSESLAGLMSLRLRENLLQIKGENLSLLRLLELVRLPSVLDAQLSFSGVYNLAFQKGSLEATGQNLNIMLDDLPRYGLEAFSANNSAQDSWGVGFETSQADGRFVLEGQLDGAQLDGKLTASAQNRSIRTSKLLLNLQSQYMQIEFLEPEIKLQGKFSSFNQAVPAKAPESLQEIYQDSTQGTPEIQGIQGVQGIYDESGENSQNNINAELDENNENVLY